MPFEVIPENALFFAEFDYPEVFNSFKDFNATMYLSFTKVISCDDDKKITLK